MQCSLCMISALISLLIICTSVTSFTLHTKRTRHFTFRRSSDLRPDNGFNRLISQISIAYAGKDGIEVEPRPRTIADTTIISVIATAVALTAFSFQVFGIFPWHAKLQAGFESVKMVNEQVFNEDARIREKLNTVKRLQAEINSKMRLRE